MSFMAIAQFFRCRLPKPAVGTRQSPNALRVPRRRKQDLPACIGPLRQWWTLRATRVGGESSRAQARIRIWEEASRARACVAFRDDYGAPDKVLACAKHWVAYGAAEA